PLFAGSSVVPSTARLSLSAFTSLTTLSSVSRRFPLRSCLNTSRYTQPCPLKSANCVCLSLGLISSRSDRRNSTLRHFPRSEDSSGLRDRICCSSEGVGFSKPFSPGLGYICSPSVSRSHQVVP